MNETTPDPADVHTGTDRVELTDAEREALARYASGGHPYVEQGLFAAVESIIAARIEGYSYWSMVQTNEALRAELAAANARCAELEKDFEDEYNRAVAFMVERDDWEREANRAAARLSELVQEKVQAQVANLRAALTPEGTE